MTAAITAVSSDKTHQFSRIFRMASPGFAFEGDLHAPVARAYFGCSIGRNRLRIAKTAGSNPVAVAEITADQGGNRSRAGTRQRHIVGISECADLRRVGMPFHRDRALLLVQRR